MKAISFLGAGPAFETTYYLTDGSEHTAPFFPAALVRFYPVDTLLVFVTAGARSMHYDRLVELTQEFVPSILPVNIPDGRNEVELWQIFTAVADTVDPEDRVIFDITHGFRSLPFLSFLAAAYLRSIKRVTLEAVLYGALEAGDKTIRPARAPVFDLSRFVSLLDWLTASDRFIRFGDARDLAEILRDSEATPVHLAAASGDPQAQHMARILRRSAAEMEKVALPLRLARSVETMDAATNLGKALSTARVGFQQWAPPFGLIADEVRDAYAPLALADPLNPENITASLNIQRQLVIWYLEKQQIVQAVTLGNEWLLSWIMSWLGELPLNNRSRRFTVSNRVVKALKRRQIGEVEPLPNSNQPDPAEGLQKVPGLEDVLVLFGQLGELRNDLNHGGFREQAMSATTLAYNAEIYCRQLIKLPLPGQVESSRAKGVSD